MTSAFESMQMFMTVLMISPFAMYLSCMKNKDMSNSHDFFVFDLVSQSKVVKHLNLSFTSNR